MAIVVQRGNRYHIQYYDKATGKTNSKTTGLELSKANLKIAQGYAKKLQEEIDKKYDGLRLANFKPKTIQDAFEHFLENNHTKNPKTILDYKRFFKKFSETFDPSEQCAVLDKLSVEAWINQIKRLPLAQNSIHAYGKQCTHFLNFLFEYSYIPMFKINREVKTKPEKKEIIVFRDEDIIRIFGNLEGKNNNFRTLINILFYTGLRESDLLSLTVDKIDFQNQEMSYFMQKGKKYRRVPIHDDLIPVLSRRVEEVKEGKILNYNKVESMGHLVSKYFTDLGIKDRGYTARTFRKTFVTLCRNRFHIDASIVRELVGHSHGNVTDQHYNFIDMDTLKIELRKFRRPV